MIALEPHKKMSMESQVRRTGEITLAIRLVTYVLFELRYFGDIKRSTCMWHVIFDKIMA